MRDAAACAAFAEKVFDRTGRIDLLVNNAGVIRDNPLAALEDEDVRVVLETNVTGTFNMTRAVAPYMISQRRGKIVNISSVSGEKGGRGQTNYAASKGAINAFTRVAGRRSGAARHHRQRRGAGRHRNRDVPRGARTGRRRRSSPAFCCAALAGRRKWPTPSGFWVRGTRTTSRARSCTWMADSRWNNSNMTKHQTSPKKKSWPVYPKVAETMADALGCDVDKVKLDASLIDDLGAESIDFLDIVFRLERAFKVKIPRGKIVEEARGDLSEAEFEQGGVVSEAGLQRLKVFLSEVPAERFKSPLKVADIPRLFTTETFCKMVIRQQRAAAAARRRQRE